MLCAMETKLSAKIWKKYVENVTRLVQLRNGHTVEQVEFGKKANVTATNERLI